MFDESFSEMSGLGNSSSSNNSFHLREFVYGSLVGIAVGAATTYCITSIRYNSAIQAKKEERLSIDTNDTNNITVSCTPRSLTPYVQSRISRIESVLFDMDGTLVESSQIWYLLLQSAAAHFGHPVIERKAWETTFGQSMEKNVELFLQGTSQQDFNTYCDDHYRDFIDHLEILPGATSALDECAKRWENLVIITNCPRKITEIILESTGLLKYFKHVICAGDVVPWQPNHDRSISASCSPMFPLEPKPSTTMLEYASHLVGTNLHKCMFVGDSRFDMQAAKAAACLSVGIGIRQGLIHCNNIDDFGSMIKTI